MFNKLKHLKDLRNHAKTMQDALSKESVTVEKKGLSIQMNGNMEITKVTINGEFQNSQLETLIKDAGNEAVKKTQKLMAQKMQEMGGFPGLG